jgi:hypothetical protein
MGSKQKNRNATLRFYKNNKPWLRCLFREINQRAAVEKHDNYGCEKKQCHENVEDAVPLAARILNVFHFYAEMCSTNVVQK